jgi:lysozyme family protein
MEGAMAAENFNRIMDEIFRHEGGYVDHPRDPGGATNMGITIGTLRDWRGKAVTKDDVRRLTKDEARTIYRKRYWDAVCGDELPSGVDLCAMDSAVNSGPSRGARWLQRAVGADADGQIGTKTLSAADAADPTVTVQRMCDDRLSFLKGLGTWSTFGKGWARRVESVRSLALELAAAASAPVVVAPPVPTPRPAPIDIGRYSKLIGSLLGALSAWAVAQGLIPDGLFPPAQVEALATLLGAMVGTYLAPANTAPAS